MRRALAVVAVLGLASLASVSAAADDKTRCIAASEEGQQQRDAGKYAAARESFAACARDACPTIVRRDCTRWLSDLGQLQPSVVFGAKDPAGNDLSAVRVLADGVPVAETLDGKPLSIDPGEHVFRFEAAGLPAVERPFVVRAGEKNRLVMAQFVSAPRATGKAAGAGAAPAAADEIPTSAWVFGGLSMAAFGAEAYFGLTGLGDRSSLQSQPCAKTATCNPNDVASIRTKFAIADIALGVGLVSGALAAYMVFARGAARPHEVPTPAATTRRRSTLACDVVPVAGGAAASLRLEF